MYLSVLNPSCGLSLDPSDLSFILPQMGWDYDNPASMNDNNTASEYSVTVDLILSIHGYVTNADDIVCMGLVNHYLVSANEMVTLERVFTEFILLGLSGTCQEERT